MKKIFLILSLIIFGSMYAQENANWYFGDHAGLNFVYGTPQVLNDGQTPYYNYAASTTVSDRNGDLLFYSDGHHVWNKNHQIMTGSADNFVGKKIMSVMSVPIPLQPNKYYLFILGATTTNSTPVYQLYYSIIDLNTGLGNVTLLNQTLNYPTTTQGNSLLVAKHADNESYWLIYRKNNSTSRGFYSIKIDRNGISSTAVISFTQSLLGEDSTDKISDYTISQSGKQIAYVGAEHSCSNRSTKTALSSDVPSIVLFSFNRIDGHITYIYGDDYAAERIGLSETVEYLTGAEFSNNNRFLYVMGIEQYTSSVIANKVFQIDLSSTLYPSYTVNSTTVSGHQRCGPHLRMAMDGKIYVAKSVDVNNNPNRYISVINSPDLLGSSCNYVQDAVFLAGGTYTFPRLTYQNSKPCVPDLTIDIDVIPGQTDLIKTANTITAINVIEDGAVAEYTAGDVVYLKPGFHAKSGSDFWAYIAGCSIEKAKEDSTKNEKQSIESKQTKINVYPNPTDSFLNVNSEMAINKWSINDVYGNGIMKSEKDFIITNKLQINISNLKKDTYYLILSFINSKDVIKRIVKE